MENDKWKIPIQRIERGKCRNDMIEFAGDMVYKALNPKSKMDTPSMVYVKIEKELKEWKSGNDLLESP